MLDGSRLDALVITTPPLAHREQMIAGIERGMHVLIEKPLALSVEDMKAMAAAVEQHGVIASVSYQLRHLSTVEQARRLLEGRPIAAVAAHYYWTVPLVEWIKDRDLAGGQMVDQCTHLIDLCRVFAGEVRSVSAAYTNVTRRDAPGFNNWDAYSVTMTFESGAVGSVHSTYALFPGIPGGTELAIIADELLVRIDPGGAMHVFTPDGEQTFEPEGDGFRLRAALRAPVSFQCRDVRREMPDGPFDLVLCRNLVFTNFEEALQREVLSKMAERLAAGGALVVGIHESLPAGEHELLAWNDRAGVYLRGGQT